MYILQQKKHTRKDIGKGCAMAEQCSAHPLHGEAEQTQGVPVQNVDTGLRQQNFAQTVVLL